MDVAPKNGGLLNLHAKSGADLTAHLSADDHCSGRDLSLDAGPLADNERIRGMDLAPEDSADPHRTNKAQLALEFAAGLNDSGDRRMDDAGTQV